MPPPAPAAAPASPDPARVAALRAALLGWYDRAARDLPWRVGPAARARGVRPDPYRVWLSEVMLQQTTVAAVTDYFHAFTARWPTVEALAAAADGDVMAAWAGLGYYARARNLLGCARAVAAAGGVFPGTEAGLRALPGLGPYTAAAVAAIAFDRPANVVDGNVERVVARLFAVRDPLPAAKPRLAALAGALVTAERPGDWAQALMDLGATVCRPRRPLCLACPVADLCAARAQGIQDHLPAKSPKAAKPRRFGVAHVLRRAGAVALVRRPPRGLLGGMLGLPTSPWRADPWTETDADADAPAPAAWRDAGAVEHVFTHFALTLTVRVADVGATEAPEVAGDDPLVWTPEHEARRALPTVFRKALERALA